MKSYEELLAERDALMAQVEAISINRDAFREAAYKAISILQINKIELPAGYGSQCLAEIKAEAGRAGYLQCLTDYVGIVHPDFHGEMSSQYAAKIRSTGTWLRDSNVNGGKRQGGE